MAEFDEIYIKYGQQLYSFLLSLTGDEHQAEEMMQETFYQAYLHIEKFEGRSSIYTWLCQIGKNAWYKECRRRKRFDVQSEIADRVDSLSKTPEERVIQKEDFHRMQRAVYHLKQPYQDVFIMHVYGEIELVEIARMHGKSESWARVTFYRAKQMILQEVEK